MNVSGLCNASSFGDSLPISLYTAFPSRIGATPRNPLQLLGAEPELLNVEAIHSAVAPQ